MIIDIDNYIISSGSHYQFEKWIKELSKHEELLPEGLLFLAFGNEQKGQKNYLDRGFNTVIYYIVTSFVAFNIASQNKIQHNTDSSWLSEIQKEKIVEIENNIVDQLPNPLIFKPYKIDNKQSTTGFIQPITDQEVNIPEIYIPDPININPNLIANIEQVLLHIETILGIKNKVRQWMVVICDGVLYRLATKLKKKFSWLVLVPGQLHEEMNMLHTYIELN
ncbi:hypothetical protein F8M41_005790 [Gigaspora margarita]|uniref:Uncharacterized protein n=1 Tax=Gigaspora margarita TaxID=4874 RepID=A0A8H3X8W0_GIGMA|nr:hypothetical protein F8M41_005790 [Gigaspora margarita]